MYLELALPLSIDLVPASILAARTKGAYGTGTISTCTVSKITQYLMLVLVDLLVYNCIAPMIPVHVPVNTDRYCCTRVLVLYLVLFTATGTAVLHVVTNYSTIVQP